MRKLWFTRGDGVKFACEENSAHHQMMVKEGFELDEELSDPSTTVTKEQLSEVVEKVKAKIKAAKEKISAPKQPKTSTKAKAAKEEKTSETEPVIETVKEEKTSEAEEPQTSQPQ